jgi:hypothetical protein
MSYRIAQDFDYVGNDYWHWSVWIEGDDAELDQVKEVVWVLHPSFSPSRVVCSKRSDRFRLRTSGWGTFLLRAQVMLASGGERVLKHNLELEYPDASEPPQRSMASPRKDRPPTFYLSYSTEDTRLAAKLRKGLEAFGLNVLDQTRVKAGDPVNDTLRQMIEQADGIIGFVGPGEISPWVRSEIRTAASYAKPALVFTAEGAFIDGLPIETRTRQIDVNKLDLGAIAAEVRSLTKG